MDAAGALSRHDEDALRPVRFLSLIFIVTCERRDAALNKDQKVRPTVKRKIELFSKNGSGCPRTEIALLYVAEFGK